MKVIHSILRSAAECLLLLPLLPVIGLMWVARAVTGEPPGETPQPARLPAPAPRPQPAVQPRPLPRYVKRQWRRRRQLLLSRLFGQGEFVTDWQLR
jgi:hypothetical protein